MNVLLLNALVFKKKYTLINSSSSFLRIVFLVLLYSFATLTASAQNMHPTLIPDSSGAEGILAVTTVGVLGGGAEAGAQLL